MIVQLITAIALSVLVVLIAWALFRSWKRTMPRYLIPMLLSITVIGYGVYSEYTWESRTLFQMPESMQVVHRVAGKSAFAPWSYVLPRTNRLSVLDTESIRRNPDYPDYALVDLLLLQRFNPVARARQLIDCDGSRRADLINEPVFDEQGLPVDLQWQVMPAGHELVRAACSTQ